MIFNGFLIWLKNNIFAGSKTIQNFKPKNV